MPDETELGRDELRRLRPKVYLQDRGCVDEKGQPQADLAGNFATAACITFEDAEVAPQEFLAVYEALKQCLALSDENDSALNLNQTADEAFDLTAGLLGKQVNGEIVNWLREWFPFVENESGVAALMQHLNSVVKQYSLVMSLKQRA